MPCPYQAAEGKILGLLWCSPDNQMAGATCSFPTFPDLSLWLNLCGTSGPRFLKNGTYIDHDLSCPMFFRLVRAKLFLISPVCAWFLLIGEKLHLT